MQQEQAADEGSPRAWWSGSLVELSMTPDARLLGQLAHAATQGARVNPPQRLRAWSQMIAVLRAIACHLPSAFTWQVLIGFKVPRLGVRIDIVLLSQAVIFVLELKPATQCFAQADRRQVEDCALDLHDFHAASRGRPIVPILVAAQAASLPQTLPFLFPGITACVMQADRHSLPGLLGDLSARVPRPRHPIDARGWEFAPYHPVPDIVQAACLLFARHDVADIASARADATNLTRTMDRIAALIAEARAASRPLILFVTGIPGAGKTLCGLNAAFGIEAATGAAFLTGNPTLVHVLREALVRDAVKRGTARRNAEHRMKAVIQALPRFRDDLVERHEAPPEHVIVIDEAQRCWTAAQAIGKSRDRPVRLDRSEPAHLLDIMARHPGFACIICLIGNGQEIHDGEGGLAEWGDALRSRPRWHIAAAPQTLTDAEPRNRLPARAGLKTYGDLHLSVPVRSLRSDAAPVWVDAVLHGDAPGARAIIDDEGEVPFWLTRSLSSMRAALRANCRGVHRAGLVSSAGARRLRAEGLGAELPHMDADAVARWFLDRYPADVRASDALDQVATQFSVQGLELDHVGLCWDGDLIRVPGQTSWRMRSFRGTDWQIGRNTQKIAYRLNSYRVLLTRARFDTIIWVPPGDATDRTRDPATLDGVAAFLQECGVRDLEPPAPGAASVPAARPAPDG